MGDMMSIVKEASVAGLFYPSDPIELSASIENFYSRSRSIKTKRPLAIIAPHAGHLYSGELATQALSLLKDYTEEVCKIAVIAPAHTLPLTGVAITSAESFRTPLGLIPIDHEENLSLQERQLVTLNDRAFANEHGIKVFLPIIQKIVPNFTLLPLVMGNCTASAAEEIIDKLIADNFFVIISTDLSHSLPYLEAKRVDQKTAELIMKKRWSELNPQHACGHYALQGILKWCKNQNRTINQIDVINSGDTAGDKSKVVGYGAWYIT